MTAAAKNPAELLPDIVARLEQTADGMPLPGLHKRQRDIGAMRVRSVAVHDSGTCGLKPFGTCGPNAMTCRPCVLQSQFAPNGRCTLGKRTRKLASGASEMGQDLTDAMQQSQALASLN